MRLCPLCSCIRFSYLSLFEYKFKNRHQSLVFRTKIWANIFWINNEHFLKLLIFCLLSLHFFAKLQNFFNKSFSLHINSISNKICGVTLIIIIIFTWSFKFHLSFRFSFHLLLWRQPLFSTAEQSFSQNREKPKFQQIIFRNLSTYHNESLICLFDSIQNLFIRPNGGKKDEIKRKRKNTNLILTNINFLNKSDTYK